MPTDPRIKDWPKANRVLYPVTLPPYLKFRPMPGQQYGCLAILAILAALICPILAGLVLSDRGKQPIFMALGLFGGFGGMFAVLLPVTRYISKKQRETDEANQEPDPNWTYVGIAFSDAMTNLNNDSSWDRGYARIENDSLVYSGYNTNFNLPLQLIRAVTPKRFGDGVSSRYPCVFIEWADQDVSEFIFFEFRLGPTSAGVDATEEFVRKILAAKSAQTAPPLLLGQLPIKSSQFMFSNVPTDAVLKPFDYVIAFLITLAIGLVVTLGIAAVFKKANVGGIVGGMSVIIFFGVLQTMQNSKRNKK